MNRLLYNVTTLKRMAGTCLYVLLVVALLVGCQANSTGPQNNQKNASKQGAAPSETVSEPVPVTIKIGVRYLNDKEVSQYIIEPVKKKYPWITIEYKNYKFEDVNNLIVAGEVPDIFVTNSVNGMTPFEQTGLFTSIEELIKKHGMDLSRFEPETLEAIRAAASRKDLVGIPYTRNFYTLYYNKEIFDRFAVPYPKDGMTWDEVTELARKLTRNENGVQYRGLEPNAPERLAAQLSLPFINSETKRATINTEKWKKVLDQMTKIYKIPGNEEMVQKGDAVAQFSKERRLAMVAEANIINEEGLRSQPEYWDMVSFPVWPEAPHSEPAFDGHVMILSATSKHKDDAFRVMSAVVSDEVQLDMSRNGKVSLMKDPKFDKVFAENVPHVQGKNLRGAFSTSSAKPYDANIFDRIGIEEINKEFKNVVHGSKDLNTALRDAEESINQKIIESGL